MEIKRALVLSGGGANGPFHLGLIEELFAQGRRYDAYFGVSVGALVAAGLAQIRDEDWETEWPKLRDLFLNITSNQLYSDWHIFSKFAAIWSSSVYDTSKLRKLIDKNIKIEKLCASGKHLSVGAVNLNSGQYKTFDTRSPHIVEGVKASCAFPVMFESVLVGSEHYTDGGVRNVTPLQDAIDAGYRKIDVSVCVPKEAADRVASTTFEIGLRCVQIMSDEIASTDLCMKEHPEFDISVWRPKKVLVNNSLEFKPSEAKALYTYAKKLVSKNPTGNLG